MVFLLLCPQQEPHGFALSEQETFNSWKSLSLFRVFKHWALLLKSEQQSTGCHLTKAWFDIPGVLT